MPKFQIDKSSTVVALDLDLLTKTLFVVASIACWLDAMTTYVVLHRVGLSKEGNTMMGSAMQHFGLGPACAARFLIGVGAFFLLTSHMTGSHFFLTGRGLHRFRRREWRWYWRAKVGPFRRFGRNVIHHATSIELVFAIIVTYMVVGNNIRAVLTLSKFG